MISQFDYIISESPSKWISLYEMDHIQYLDWTLLR